MTRLVAGGTPDAVATAATEETRVAASNTPVRYSLVVPRQQFLVYQTKTGATRLTDLLLVNADGSDGTAVAAVVADDNGQVPAFKLPDGLRVNGVWLDPVDSSTDRFWVPIRLGPADADLAYAAVTRSGHRAVGQGEAVLNVMDFGAQGDTRSVTDAVVNSTTTITSATAAFTPADVGKTIVVRALDQSRATFVSTIAGFTSATSVTMAASIGYSAGGLGLDVGTDDTAAIQAVLDSAPTHSRVELGLGRTFLVTNLRITSKTRLTFDGNGGALRMAGTITGGLRPGVELVGTCRGITIKGHRFVGSGVITDQHAAVFCSSGQTLSDIKIIENSIAGTTLGISLSATGAGSLSGLLVSGNNLDTIVGTAGGYGYGIHVNCNSPSADGVDYAATGVRIVDNNIRNVSRHSIYYALGAAAVIAHNTITDHRRDVGVSGQILPAINVSRSSEIVVANNVMSDYYGGAVLIGGPGTVTGPPTTVSRHVTVEGNIIRRPLEAISAIIVGQQDPATDGGPDGVTISHNSYYSGGATGAGFLVVYSGRHGLVAGNRITITGSTASVSVVRFTGTGETTGTATYTNDWTFTDSNQWNLTGNTGSMFLYRLSGAETTAIAMTLRTGVVLAQPRR